MPKVKIVIVGCGFAGQTAAAVLTRFHRHCEVTVIDKSRFFNFLPCLPDTIGRHVHAEYLTYPISVLSKRYNFNFINDEVQTLDHANKTIATRTTTIAYDYALIASGSETNFYGNSDAVACAYKVDDAQDARRLKNAIDNKNFDYYVVVGAGYTGIEIATNLRHFLDQRKTARAVVMIEKAPNLLGPLPDWMRDYVAANLQALGIEVYVNTSIAKIQGDTVVTTDNRGNQKTFSNSIVAWTAGVKTADFIQKLTVEKTPQGRVKVDPYLRLNDNCFFTGDSACVMHTNTMLRMAVQFAITQGHTAASNIIRSIRGRTLKPYKPFDFGYIIPMANNRACARVLGVNMKNTLPLWLHYCVCVYRSQGWINKRGLAGDFLKTTYCHD